MNWREIVARLPLPMLALAASWGVYSFQRLFVPEFFAIVSAASFELVYIGMALVMTPDKYRATAISLGAVGVSVVYNTLAGLFHRNPAWLDSLSVEMEIGLSVLHGLPLAGLAWVVADLLFHTQQAHIPDGSYSVPGNLLALANTQTILVMPASSSSSSRYALPSLPREALLEEVEEPAEAAAEEEEAELAKVEEVEEPAEEQEQKKRQKWGAGSSVTPEEEAAILAAAEEVKKERGSVNRSEVCRRVFQSPYRGRYSTKVKTVLDAVGR